MLGVYEPEALFYTHVAPSFFETGSVFQRK